MASSSEQQQKDTKYSVIKSKIIEWNTWQLFHFCFFIDAIVKYSQSCWHLLHFRLILRSEKDFKCYFVAIAAFSSTTCALF